MAPSSQDARRLEHDAKRGDLDALVAWARVALRHGDASELSEIAELLYAQWQEKRLPELADALVHLSPALESPDAAALRGYPKAKIPSEDWERVAEHERAVDRAALVETASRGSMASIRERVARMLTWPPDPRVSRGLAHWLLDLPFRATSSRAVWLQIFDLIERAADDRVVECLQPTVAERWSWPCGATMQGWFSEEIPKLIERLGVSVGAHAEANTSTSDALCELAMMQDAPTPERLGDTEADAVRLARSQIDAAIDALPDPTAWLDAIYHLGVLADADDIEALVDRVWEAIAAHDARWFPMPEDWFAGLEDPEKRAHPALRICRYLDLGGVPAKVSVTKVEKILSRPELRSVTEVDVVVRHFHKRVVGALLALPQLRRVALPILVKNKDLEKLVDVPDLLAWVTSLSLSPEWSHGAWEFKAETVRALAESGQLGKLESLFLDVGLAELEEMTRADLPSLWQLTVVPRRTFDPAVLMALVDRLPALRHLDIRPTPDTQKASSQMLGPLSSRDAPDLVAYRFNSVSERFAEDIDRFVDRHANTLRVANAYAPCAALVSALGRCHELETLDIYCPTVKGRAALRDLKPTWPRLKTLILDGIERRNAVLSALFSSTDLPALETLEIGVAMRDVAGVCAAIALLRSPLRNLMVRLDDLEDGGLSDVDALCGSRHRDTLEQLELRWCDLSAEALTCLLRDDWPALRRLELGSTRFDDAMMNVLLETSWLRARAAGGKLTLAMSNCSVPKKRQGDLAAAFVGALER